MEPTSESSPGAKSSDQGVPEKASAPDATAIAGRISENIEALSALRHRAEDQVDRHQRLVEKIAGFVSRPNFVYFILFFSGTWISTNLLLMKTGLGAFDPPPFFWFQGLVTLSSLLLMIVLVTRQKREARLVEQMAQLNLQVDLLAEQKIAKIIALLEELRRDLPIVENRKDPEAEAMKKSPDPDVVATALENTRKN